MVKNLLIGFLVILVIGLSIIIGFKIAGDEDTWICQNGEWIKHGQPDYPMPSEPCNSNNIRVSSPSVGQVISSPLQVSGQARTFEATINARLSENGGRILVEEYGNVNMPDMGQFGPFELNLSFSEPQKEKLVLEVFQYSAKDGSEIDKVIIPLNYSWPDLIDVQVFFDNSLEDPGTLNCESVFPVTRKIQKTQAIARATLNELLQGPTQKEQAAGYFSNINQGVVIQGINIENGIARVDFSKELDRGIAGSCRAQAIRSQINETLRQFTSIQEVIISIDGKTQTILQP